ncbi:MAG: nitrilase-related carbon-nitrogen hydrolase [Desulfococcaceae bacterium]
MRDIRAALVISNSPAFRVLHNLEQTARLTRQAAEHGAAIVCFPEMNITGYDNSREIRETAQTVPGPAGDRLSEVAARENIVILAGMAERDEMDRIYASHLVIRPSGEISVYRKLHIAPPEKEIFSPGNAVPVFEAGGICFGIQLCYDAHFPELSTLMAEKGADLIFIPHASPRGTPEDKFSSWMRHLPARAYDNSLFVMACNQTGDSQKKLKYPGIAMAIDPSGRVIGKKLSDRDDLLIADLKAEDMDRVRSHKMRFFLPNRRPGLYDRAMNGS